MEQLTRPHIKVRLLALLPNIRLGLKWLAVRKALAYNIAVLITVVILACK